MREIQLALDVLFSKYENTIIIGDFNSEPKKCALIDFCQPYDFNSEPKESALIDFCQPYDMENLINNFTLYKP